MKRTFLLSAVIITAILALNFSLNNVNRAEDKAASHTVEICFQICSSVPPPTKAHVVDAFGHDFGECELTNGNCCKVYNVPDGFRHIHFTQDGTTFCDGPDFLLTNDIIVTIPCHCP